MTIGRQSYERRERARMESFILIIEQKSECYVKGTSGF
jgi:hypothetical protein